METSKKLKETGEMYEAPVMEIIEVQVEQGFQMSEDPLKEIERPG